MREFDESKLDLQRNIDEVLNKRSNGILVDDDATRDEIIEQLGIYYQELEYQNLELRRIRDELEVSRKHYYDLFNEAPLGYVIFSTNHKIKSTNSTLQKMIGLDSVDLYNKAIDEFVHKDKQDAFYMHIKELLRDGRTSSVQLVLKGVTGDIPVKVESNLMQLSESIVIRSAMLDITQEKMAEEELKIAKERADSASMAKSQFVANISHEIRTPLNGVLGFLQLLVASEVTDEQLKYIQYIKYSADILLTVVNDILDISKIEAGRLEFEYIPFDIRSAVETAVVSFGEKITKKGVDLNIKIGSKVPQLLIGDPIRLRQVITNLVGNAVKFTEHGYINIDVELKKQTETSCEIDFTIEDTGIGIQEDVINKLFKPFVQANGISVRNYGGTGLGLAISKNIVELMGGEINISSEYGIGSVVKFSVVLNKAYGTDIPWVANYSVLMGKRILIIDNDEESCTILRRYLEEVGCIVSVVACANEAVNKFIDTTDNEEICNLILVDCKVHENIQGNICSILTTITSTLNIPVVLAYSGDIKERATQTKFSGYVSKPYDRIELLNCVTMLVDTKHHIETKGEHFLTKSIRLKPNFNNKIKILLVEDDEMSRLFLTNALKIKGFSCDVAESGEVAILLHKKNEYDLIFLDCQMPGINGFETTHKIRQMEGDKKHTHIVAMTACVMQDDAQRCLNEGMDDYISKPVDINQVITAIHKHVEKCNI